MDLPAGSQPDLVIFHLYSNFIVNANSISSARYIKWKRIFHHALCALKTSLKLPPVKEIHLKKS